jgi:hypothetical protein
LKWSVLDALQLKLTSSTPKSTNEGIQSKRKDTYFPMWSNTTLSCLFYWASTLPAALRSFRQEADNFSLDAARANLKRMSSILQKVMKEHEQEVLTMGYDSINDVGIHSIHKGAADHGPRERHLLPSDAGRQLIYRTVHFPAKYDEC